MEFAPPEQSRAALKKLIVSRLSNFPQTRSSGSANDLDTMEPGMRVEDAAVLIPIVTRGHPQVLLTQRTDHLARHPGQIAFPGGRVDAQDYGPVAAALREAQEEVGLNPALVETIGAMPRFITGTGYSIVPIVALVAPNYELEINAHEVVEAFEVPLDVLMDPAQHARKEAEFRGRARSYYEIIYGRYRIWGVTAGIIVELYRALYAADGEQQ